MFESLKAGAVREGMKQSLCPPRAQHEGVHGNKEGLAQNFVTALKNRVQELFHSIAGVP